MSGLPFITNVTVPSFLSHLFKPLDCFDKGVYPVRHLRIISNRFVLIDKCDGVMFASDCLSTVAGPCSETVRMKSSMMAELVLSKPPD